MSKSAVTANRIQNQMRLEERHGIKTTLPPRVHVADNDDEDRRPLCGAEADAITRKELTLRRFRPEVCLDCDDVIWGRRKRKKATHAEQPPTVEGGDADAVPLVAAKEGDAAGGAPGVEPNVPAGRPEPAAAENHDVKPDLGFSEWD